MLSLWPLISLWTKAPVESVAGRSDDSNQTRGCAQSRHAILHVSSLRKHRWADICNARTDALPLDEFDRLEGFVHIADGQIEAEVEHGVTGGLLTVLQAHEVSESSSGHHVGELGGRPPWWLGLVRRCWCCGRNLCWARISLTRLKKGGPGRKTQY